MKSTSLIKYILTLALSQLGCGDYTSHEDQRSLTSDEEKPSSQLFLVKSGGEDESEGVVAFALFDTCPDNDQCIPIKESVVNGEEACIEEECGKLLRAEPDCGSLHTLRLTDDINYCSQYSSNQTHRKEPALAMRSGTTTSRGGEVVKKCYRGVKYGFKKICVAWTMWDTFWVGYEVGQAIAEDPLPSQPFVTPPQMKPEPDYVVPW